jgi:hypothetical protein
LHRPAGPLSLAEAAKLFSGQAQEFTTMFGIRYLKVAPTVYVMHHKEGKIVREGAGLSFFYFGPSSEIVLVPMSSTDVPFVFNEVTADFQDATIQGELTYRIVDAKRVAALLDFSVGAGGRSSNPTNGIESDFLQFNSGAIARIGVSKQQARLVVA